MSQSFESQMRGIQLPSQSFQREDEVGKRRGEHVWRHLATRAHLCWTGNVHQARAILHAPPTPPCRPHPAADPPSCLLSSNAKTQGCVCHRRSQKVCRHNTPKPPKVKHCQKDYILKGTSAIWCQECHTSRADPQIPVYPSSLISSAPVGYSPPSRSLSTSTM